MPKKKQNPDISFEDSILRLTEIVGEIESGEPSLEGTINLYKEGLTLAQKCGDILGDYKSEVQKLQKQANETFILTTYES